MAYTFHLCDIKTDTLLADVTSIALTTTIKARLNKPLQIDMTMPSDQALLNTVWTDGDPYLYPASRSIKAYKNGVLIGHCIVMTCSWTGSTETDYKVEIICLDPLIRLQSRNVFDHGNHIADFSYVGAPGYTTDGSGNPVIDAGSLLKEAISRSETNEDGTIVLSGTPYTPATFPIDYTTGTFSTTVNVWSLLTDGPMTIGDLVSQITDTGAADVVLTPTDTSLGAAAGVMAVLSVVDAKGTDRSATVHFDYDTGSKNVSAISRVLDATTLGNRIIYLIGTKVRRDAWMANVSGTEAALAAYQLKALTSRVKFGTYAQERVYDSNDDSLSALPLYHALWKTETTLRHNPRELVYITPAAAGDNFVQFTPFAAAGGDYDPGDLVAINTSANVGPAIAATKQRIYGFDVTVPDTGVETVGQLVTSADAE